MKKEKTHSHSEAEKYYLVQNFLHAEAGALGNVYGAPGQAIRKSDNFPEDLFSVNFAMGSLQWNLTARKLLIMKDRKINK